MSENIIEKALEPSEIIKLAAAEGAKAAIEKYKKEQQKELEKRNDKRLHNIRLLLSNYRDFKQCSENATYNVEQAEDSIDFLDLMWDPYNRSDLEVESIKISAVKTTIMVAHIDCMLETLKKLSSHNAMDERKYNILFDRYIADVPLSINRIAKKYNIERRMVYYDIDAAVERMAKLIFGIDYVLFDKIDNGK